MFAGSDDGFIAMYDERLNFEKDWHGQEHGVNCLAVGLDEKDTTWLYSCSAFGEIKQWWPGALELLYQNTAEHPDTESKVRDIPFKLCKAESGNIFVWGCFAGNKLNFVLFCSSQQT